MSKALTIKNLLPVQIENKLVELENKLSNTTYVGVDFGTSTTVVSIATKGSTGSKFSVKTIELNQRLSDGTRYSSYKVPTIIAWYKNMPLIGEGAKELKYKLRKGRNLWHSFKMELGEDIGYTYPNSELGRNHEKLTILTPVDAGTFFFKYLNAQIQRYIRENNLPSNIEYAVSIPAAFEANQRKDLIQCIESNGMVINKQSLIDEPNAAFLSYILDSEHHNTTIKIPEDYYPNVLVFDFGAGTCDISILEIGQDYNGVYSKNIAISKFEKLGGDDIDNLIAIDILLPQLLDNTGLTQEDFLTRELKELIIPKLLPTAERLKILMSESVSLQLSSKSLEEISELDDSITLGRPVRIETKKGILTIQEPTLKYKDFAGINELFTREKSLFSSDRIEGELEFISVFTPIKSALQKAKLQRGDIDYVLFIGGSSKNPYIQKAISSYFSDSENLIPRDLQAHVSAGAALHSIVYNGYGKNIIQPITSEPILLITKDGYCEKVESIIEAGTVIPTDIKFVDNLTPQRDGQTVVEFPICIGNKNKILYNIKVFNSGDKAFRLSDKIKLEFEINADKLLLMKASVADKRIMVEPISPFSNKELTTEERIRQKAEKEYNIEVGKNNGRPTLEGLKRLHKVYERIGLEFKAAETLELISELFPKSANLNNIGLHYSNAGKQEKALSFYKRAMQESPSSTTAFNLALQYRHVDSQKYKEYIKKAYDLNPQSNTASYNYGKVLREEGQEAKGLQIIQNAFDRWQKKFDTNKMEKWDYSWFASCARTLGKDDYAQHIEDSRTTENFDLIYNSDNLTQLTQQKGLQKK